MQILSKEKFRQIHRLGTEKGREKEGRFLIEGLHLCEEALLSDWEVELLLFPADFILSQPGKKAEVLLKRIAREAYRIGIEEIEKLADTQTPQGVFAVVKKKNFVLEKAFLQKASLLLGLDNIRDPGNLGTIIRTADSAGVDGLLLAKGCVELYNPKVVRSTMGSIFHLPLIENLELKDTILELKNSGFKTYASEVHKGKNYTEIKYPEKICLLIGSEATGIDKELLKLTDEKIKIPIYGKAESLNASVATGILLYEIVRQRQSLAWLEKGNFLKNET